MTPFLKKVLTILVGLGILVLASILNEVLKEWMRGDGAKRPGWNQRP